MQTKLQAVVIVVFPPGHRVTHRFSVRVTGTESPGLARVAGYATRTSIATEIASALVAL
jgi:hypothetical protein